MTEGGGVLSPEVGTGAAGAQGFSKEAIGAATSKLISAHGRSFVRKTEHFAKKCGLLAAFIFLTAGSANALKCKSLTETELVATNELIFTGVVRSVKAVNPEAPSDQRRYTADIDLETAFKPNDALHQRRVTIGFTLGGNRFDYWKFSPGQRLTVFAQTSDSAKTAWGSVPPHDLIREPLDGVISYCSMLQAYDDQTVKAPLLEILSGLVPKK